MTWLTDEQGVATSRPIDLYELVADGVTYRYTSHRKDVSYGGNTWTAIAAQRRSLAIVGQGAQDDLVIELDVASTFVQAMAVRGLPPQSMTAIVRQMQAGGDVVKLYEGELSPPRLQGQRATVRISPWTSDPLRANVSGLAISRRCLNVVYDAERGGRCAAARASFDVATTVVSQDGVELEVAGDGGMDADWFDSGEAVIGLQHRTIVKRTGLVLTLLSPFVGLAGSEAVTLYAGCKRDIETCRDKFGQVANFTGYPYLKPKNPFVTYTAWEG